MGLTQGVKGERFGLMVRNKLRKSARGLVPVRQRSSRTHYSMSYPAMLDTCSPLSLQQKDDEDDKTGALSHEAIRIAGMTTLPIHSTVQHGYQRPHDLVQFPIAVCAHCVLAKLQTYSISQSA
jgi:hypothetical protein